MTDSSGEKPAQEVLIPYVVCPTKNCPAAVSFGAITTTDRNAWVEGFEPKKIPCKLCGKTTTYTGADVLFKETIDGNS